VGSTERWSKDWEHFDWKAVWDKLPEAIKDYEQGLSFDVGISKGELIEYLEWLKENKPMEFFQLMDKLWKARADNMVL